MSSVQYKYYLFDFDGTLVDSMPCWSQKMLNILDETNTPRPKDIIKTITPLGDAGTAAYFRDVLGVGLTKEEMFAIMDAYALPRYRDEIPAKEGVAVYLRALRAGGCSLNVLTASPHRMLDPCLKRLGLYALFDNVWSCDDFGTTKSDPGIYLSAVSRMGCTPGETVFFDDNVHAVKTAACAGLGTVGVYDDSAADFAYEMKQTADRYIMTFAGLGPVEK